MPRDEPKKLLEIVVPLLSGDRNQSIALRNGSIAELALGSADQDDCAAYRVSGDVMLVAGSDYIRGVGFHLYEIGYMSDYDVGWYLAGANLSDVASMGAVPLGLLSVIRYPKEMNDSRFEDLLRGISDACRSVGALNVGGDIGSADAVILSGAAFGLVEPDCLLTRSGAQPGDFLCLTGPTGEAGAAMKLSRAGLLDVLDLHERDELLLRWRRVAPRVAQGRVFAGSGAVSSCVDTSDGLKAAIVALAGGSGNKVVVNSSAVPVSRAVRGAAHLLNVPSEEIVLGDSVDFELLASVSPDGLSALQASLEESGMPLHVIGHFAKGQGVYWEVDGRVRELPGQEWRH